MVIADWAIELGIDRSTLRDRIARGMAPEEAVLMPKQVETTAVPVHQIDLAGNLVREYESLGAVGRTLTPHCPDNGKKGVSAVLHNKRSTYKGYKWEYSKTTQLCAIIDEWT